ncbi:MAG TPA: PAS domain S-box protein, partial [Bradyrhizobium sp.]|nr:PAS domain S-box protein [Bradyrhizobium sp.]
MAIAIGLGFFLLQHFEAKLTPFLLAVAATVWYAGTGPGVLAIVLSVLSLNYFFLRPGFSFSPISTADLVYLTFCIFCALAVGWVSAVRRRAEQELRQAREELEAKVAERTADLARSERYLAEAQRLTHCGVTAYKGSTVFYGSEEIYRIWGFDPAQGVPSRKAVLQRIHPDDRDRLNAVVERALAEKRRYSAAYRIVLPDGTVKHLESIGQPVFSTNGELVEVVATQIDVTERKRAEEALRESEAKIRRLVDSNIIGIFVWDFDGRILEANDEFLRMVSYGREDLVSGRIRWAELTPPDWRERNNARIEREKNSGRFEPFEKEFTRKDGSRVPILIGGATFEAGGSQGVAFVLDLTERKCAEQALREREAQLAEARRELRQMIDTIPIPVASYSADARRDFVNAAWKQYTGLSDEAALGTRWSVVAHPDDIAGGDKMWHDAFATGEPWHTEERVRRADGQYRWFAIDRVAARDENGKIIKWYGTAYDIEDRKRAEERLRVQHTVAQILAEAASIEEATPRILLAMGECLGWDVGALWRVDREPEALRCVELWHKASIEVPEFESISRKFDFVPGVGLPGRVWSNLKPEYIPDVV